MRTTLSIENNLLAEASRLTGVLEKTSLVRMGLEALIARQSARGLADLGGGGVGAATQAGSQKTDRKRRMRLADTSIRIYHLRNDNVRLREYLYNNDVCIHPFVTGEIACGSLKNRAEILHLLQALPQVPVAAHQEVLDLVLNSRLYHQGIGWIDAHLLTLMMH